MTSKPNKLNLLIGAGVVIVLVAGIALALNAPRQVTNLDNQAANSDQGGAASEDGAVENESELLIQQLIEIDAQLDRLQSDLDPNSDLADFANPLAR